MRVELSEYTLDRCDEVWRVYKSDPLMTDEPFFYDAEWVKRYHRDRMGDSNRRLFAVVSDGKTVGEAQLKRLDWERRCATLSLVLAEDEYKNRGIGSEALRLLLCHAFETLRLDCIYADCTLKNTRSAHVLENRGFVFTHTDGQFRYYELSREVWEAARSEN
ncbi:MAG: GNAT family protein [Clostridia bacterium]|nr:GNAT family protein [Clostridia bacterium]